MAGLMAKRGGGRPMEAAEGREPMQPGGASPAPNGGGGERRKASPEEQHAHDEFIGNAVNALYQEPMAKSVLNMMENTQDTPAATLANAASIIVSSTLASAEENGMAVIPDIVARASAKVISEIATELLPAAGMQPVGPDEMKAAHARSMEILREQKMAGEEQAEGSAAGMPQEPPAGRGNGLMPGMGMGRGG